MLHATIKVQYIYYGELSPGDGRNSKREAFRVTDKEFKRLTRAQLIEVIYQLQLQVDQLTEQKLELEAALEDKRLRIREAGNLAEAALEINDCFRSAQNAAAQYVSEIQAMREETQAECARLLAEAQAQAEAIVTAAKKTHTDYDSAIEAILQEYRHKRADDR